MPRLGPGESFHTLHIFSHMHPPADRCEVDEALGTSESDRETGLCSSLAIMEVCKGPEEDEEGW